MKTFWKDLLFLFTWRHPLTGKRHLFGWTRALLIVLGLSLLLTGGLWGWRLWSELREKPAVPESPPPTARDLFLARLAACPKDAAEWTLKPIPDLYRTGEQSFLARSPLMALPSPCHYDLLGREVAFFMLRYMGYGAEEAHRLVGIDRFYYRRPSEKPRPVLNEVGPYSPVLLSPMGLESDLLTWNLAPDGSYPMAFVVWGCYSGRGAGRAGEYDYECLVRQLLMPVRAFFRFGEAVFKQPPGADAFAEEVMFWGYRGEGRWELIGTVERLLPVEDPSYTRRVYEEVARSHGTVVWDGAWLKATFGAEPRPLPQGAESWPSDQAAGDRILKLVQEAEGWW